LEQPDTAEENSSKVEEVKEQPRARINLILDPIKAKVKKRKVLLKKRTLASGQKQAPAEDEKAAEQPAKKASKTKLGLGFPCPDCRMTSFKTFLGLNSHRQIHCAKGKKLRNMGSKGFPCADCDKAFISARGLAVHKAQLHSWIACHSCHKNFCSNKKLQIHLKMGECVAGGSMEEKDAGTEEAKKDQIWITVSFTGGAVKDSRVRVLVGRDATMEAVMAKVGGMLGCLMHFMLQLCKRYKVDVARLRMAATGREVAARDPVAEFEGEQLTATLGDGAGAGDFEVEETGPLT
jgi:hypothetical protein